VEKLRADAQRDRDQLAQVRAKLIEAEIASRLTPWLAGAAIALLALVVWLWLRLRRAQREQHAQWWAAANAAAQGRQPPISPPTLQPMTLPPELAPTPPARPVAAAKPAAPAPGPSSAFADSMMAEPPRDVSIEELIDLEQQADFFVVLGQDDAAIDLLMGHIRSSGGTSPLPYLKLMEIYRRLGDHEAYERTRARFNHRFNAYAPDWDADLQHGRTLDQYPDVIARLVHSWKSPLDAMAELEALMFRRDEGEVFDLPAYREVLFLYSMARDLLDHQGGPPSVIDVLLPLAENDFESTTARPHLLSPESAGPADHWRPTQAPIEVLRGAAAAAAAAAAGPASGFGTLDLDLTQPMPMFEEARVRDDPDPEQRSDFLDLPPPAPPRN
jgi:pilus assembly protein FimV